MANELQIMDNAIRNVKETLLFQKEERDRLLTLFRIRASHVEPEEIGCLMRQAEELRAAHEKMLCTHRILENLVSVKSKMTRPSLPQD